MGCNEYAKNYLNIRETLRCCCKNSRFQTPDITVAKEQTLLQHNNSPRESEEKLRSDAPMFEPPRTTAGARESETSKGRGCPKDKRKCHSVVISFIKPLEKVKTLYHINAVINTHLNWNIYVRDLKLYSMRKK